MCDVCMCVVCVCKVRVYCVDDVCVCVCTLTDEKKSSVFESSKTIKVVKDFKAMGLKQDLLKGVFQYGMYACVCECVCVDGLPTSPVLCDHTRTQLINL